MDFFAGRRRVDVTFSAPTSARDAIYNTPVSAWVDLPPMTGWVEDVLPSRADSMANGIDIAARPCRLRIRWREGIGPQMRVNIDGRSYAIIAGPAELGRRDGLEMMCEHHSTQGETP